MNIETSRDAGVATVTVRGEMDVSSAYDVYVAAVGAGEEGLRRVTLDLAQVSFLDSVGLSMLIRTRDELANHGSQLVLRSPSRQVAQLLRLTALDAHFAIST